MKIELSIRQKLSIIQCELKAPKNKSMVNKGKVIYKYRDLDSIYESLKPMLSKYGCYVTVDDSIEVHANVIFRKSVATISCTESGESESATMLTRESGKIGIMSCEQSSGSSASYSNRYAMNKLFLLDDSENIDSLTEDDKSYKTPSAWKAVGNKTIKQLGPETVKAIVAKLNAKPELTEDDRSFLAAVAR